MILVTRLNNENCIVNADLIELIENTPDTLLTLTTGRKLMVRESSSDIIEKVISFRERSGLRLAHPGMLACGPRAKVDDNDDDEDDEAPKLPRGGFLRLDSR